MRVRDDAERVRAVRVCVTCARLFPTLGYRAASERRCVRACVQTILRTSQRRRRHSAQIKMCCEARAVLCKHKREQCAAASRRTIRARSRAE